MIARPTEDGTFRYPTLKEGEANALKLGRLLHAVIGKVTEAAEALDNLKKHIFYGKPIDEVNLIEEQGDGHWYDAILYDALGADPEETLQKNIAKLMVRYPHKFESEQALTRDLEAERKTLEETKSVWDSLSDENKRDSEVSEKEYEAQRINRPIPESGPNIDAATESIIKDQFYVEARVGSNNYRNSTNSKPCRLIYGKGGNVPVDEILKSLAESYRFLNRTNNTGRLTEEVEKLRSDLRDRNDILAEIRSVIRMTGPSIEVKRRLDYGRRYYKYARIVEILRNHGQLS